MSPERRRLAILTTGRQDYGILRSTLFALAGDARFEPLLLVGGMHLDPRHGDTVREIEQDGLAIAARLGEGGATDSRDPAALFQRAAEALARIRPEALLLVGDRSEVAFAALAATLGGVPIVHLHGGEETEGALDNALRHAITKLSHLHLVSNELHRRRVRQMGEPDGSVHVVGAPGLDNLMRSDRPSREALQEKLGLPLEPPVVIVTHHAATLGDDPGLEIDALLAGMERIEATWLVTLPNADAGSDTIRDRLTAFARRKPRCRAVEALGARYYAAALSVADAILGNSSSALIEAPCFQVPAVNVGERQKGRLRGSNVIDVPPAADAIAAALERALSPSFREQLLGTASPYGDGRSAPRILAALADWQPPRPARKRFAELPGA